MDENHVPQWHVIGSSVQGASHERIMLPNQDAISWLPESGTGPPLILAVSDGHGSATSFRSDIGAQLAVEEAVAVCSTILTSQPDRPNLSAVKRWCEESLPREIVRRWCNAVADDLAVRPPTSEELSKLEAEKGIDDRRHVTLEPILAYGATILTLLVTESFILFTQLGDGDILTVSENGEISRPLPSDERLLGDETTSLCMREAWRDFEVSFQALDGTPPALVLVSTDGYANSFRNEADFLKIGPDYLNMIRLDGLDYVDRSLGAWLSEASHKGSGDDITLGIICRMDALAKSDEHLCAEQAEGEDNGMADMDSSSKTELPSELHGER